MKSKSPKKNKNKKAVKAAEKDPMIEHLEDEIKTDMHQVVWFKKGISEAKKKIEQNRKILEKLRKIK